METENIRITYEDLIANPPVINRKFLLVNSSFYTDEAFDYILSLINQTDAIAFICDRQLIYTHGEFYGGNVWGADLLYYKTFQFLNADSGTIIGDVTPNGMADTLRISLPDSVKVSIVEEFVDGKLIKNVKFDIKAVAEVDNTPWTIDDPTAIFNLEYTDNKISVKKYIPVRVDIKPNNPIVEYDHADLERISFDLNLAGTELNKVVTVTSSPEETVTIVNDTVFSTINTNDDIRYLIVYSDGRTQGAVEYIQKFGYRVCWSNSEINENNFFSLNKELRHTGVRCSFTLDCNTGEYCWFACPSEYIPLFRDEYSSIIGGWRRVGTFTIYSLGIEYTVWRTENSGFGKTRWTVLDENYEPNDGVIVVPGPQESCDCGYLTDKDIDDVFEGKSDGPMPDGDGCDCCHEIEESEIDEIFDVKSSLKIYEN